jgi:hypothetical protein
MDQTSINDLTRALVLGVTEDNEEIVADMIEFAENIALSMTEEEVNTAKAYAQKYLDEINFKPTIH